jgi:hypothetical protein
MPNFRTKSTRRKGYICVQFILDGVVSADLKQTELGAFSGILLRRPPFGRNIHPRALARQSDHHRRR